MTDDWLGPTEGIDTDALADEVEKRLRDRRTIGAADDSRLDSAIVAQELRQTMLPTSAPDATPIGAPSGAILLTEADCDIVPRDYVIDWQHPLLGPINARVRQVINAEIRRYLTTTLEQQSFVNRQLLQSIQQLQVENAELRQTLFEQTNHPDK